ncbi:MAG TPA: BPSS1780 family membrane protein, partial [Moraxellaceae bacterium]|nr:BPSS1780 family membrane protein [Moraxellaceae bacterium]
GRGAAWIGEAWTLFKANPGMWILAMLVFVGVQMVLNFVPLIGGIAVMLIGPILMVGILAFADGIARGEGADLGLLFIGFREKTGSLVAVAAIYFVLFLGLMVVLGVVAFILMGGAAALSAMNPDQFVSHLLGGAGAMGLLILLLVFFALLILLLAAYWFAPGLVFYAGLSAGDAMKESFFTCLRNWLPFLVFGVLSFLVLFGGLLLVFIGVLLVSAPILMATYYTSFRDIFGRKA